MAKVNNNSTDDYNECVKNCKDLFPNEPSLSTCISGCAKVSTSSDYGIFSVDASQINDQIQKLGRKEFLRKVKSASKNAYKHLLDADETKKLDDVSTQYIERVTNIIEIGSRSSDWNDSQIIRYAQEVSWGKLSSDIAVSFLARDNPGGGGGGGQTCVSRCAGEYDQCVSENGCDTSGWVCVCCVPCSLQYMGCVAKCVTVGGGFGGIVIA